MDGTRALRQLGVDTGGTFTDLVVIAADGRIAFQKSFNCGTLLRVVERYIGTGEAS